MTTPGKKPPINTKPLPRKVRGIRDTIPSGYLLGRTDAGDGPVQVVPFAQFVASPAFVNSRINTIALTQAALASVSAHAVLLGEGNGTSFGSAGPGTNGQLLVGQSGADPAFKTVSGDLTMLASGAGKVTGIQGNPVSSAAPVDGQIFRWSAADGKYDLKAEFASFINSGGDTYTAMATSLTDPEVVLAGGLPVYVKNALLANLVKGVTDGSDASAGLVGEVKTASLASGSAINLTTGVQTDILTLSLPAGDWDVRGTIVFSPSGSFQQVASWVNTVSATNPPLPEEGIASFASTGTNVAVLPTGVRRFSLAATTTIYLTGNSNFSAGTVTAYGKILARRVR